MNEQIDRLLERVADSLDAADLLLKHEHELLTDARRFYQMPLGYFGKSQP